MLRYVTKIQIIDPKILRGQVVPKLQYWDAVLIR